MLLRFRAANVRPLRDEQEPSFVVPEHEQSAAARELRVGGHRTADVFPLIGIFGANASGKSNVLAALTEELMKSYLAGAFGGVPSLLEGQVERRRARPISQVSAPSRSSHTSGASG